MHRLLFTAKRVWWAVARCYSARWEKLGITHARYDFLVVVAPNGESGITQAGMARALGVSSAATSKMARLLEKLKLLRRDYLVDKRTLSLRLTDLGKEILDRVQSSVTRTAFIQEPLERCFQDRKDPVRALGDVICDFEWLAYGFAARVTFVYPSRYPVPHVLANRRLLREHAELEPAPAEDPPTRRRRTRRSRARPAS